MGRSDRRFAASAAVMAVAIAAMTYTGATEAQPPLAAIETPADGGVALLDGLIGRAWVSPEGKAASITKSPDGRYRIKIAEDVHYVNIGMPDAPGTKSSHFGTVLTDSTFQAGGNGFLLTGSRRDPHQTFFILTPDGGLRYLILSWQRAAGYHVLVGYWEFDDAERLQAGQQPGQFKRLMGVKRAPQVEARLGLPIGDAHTLIGPRAGGDVRMAAAAPSSSAGGSVPVTAPVARTAVAPTQAPVAFAAPTAGATSAGVDVKALAKQWGALAGLGGTLWTEGRNQAISIDWTAPGQQLELRRFGLWGREQVLIAPTTAGTIAAQIVAPDGTTRDAAFAPSAAGFTLTGAGEREVCTLAKADMTCRLELLSGKKWVADRNWTWRRSDVAGVERLLAQLPGVFPERSRGRFDRLRGVLATAAGHIYEGASGTIGFRTLENPGKGHAILSPPKGGFAYFTLDAHGIPSVERFYHPQYGGLVAYIPTPSGRFSEQKTPLGMSVGARGQARLLNLDGSRVNYVASEDGKMLMAIRETQNRGLWSETSRDLFVQREPINLNPHFGDIALLSDRVFQFSDTKNDYYTDFISYRAINENLIEETVFHGDMHGYLFMDDHFPYKLDYRCLISIPVGQKLPKYDCVRSNGEAYLPQMVRAGDGSFMLDRTHWTITQTRDHIKIDTKFRKNDGSFGDFREYNAQHMASLVSYYLSAELRIRQYNEYQGYRADQARKDAERQAFHNALSGIASSLGVDTNNPQALLRPTIPAGWAARMPSASGAAVGDMGGASRTAAPRMSPQQQAQWDELERIKIRDQLYHGERPTTFAEDAAANMSGRRPGGGGPGAGSRPSDDSGRRQADGGRGAGGERRAPRDTYMYCWAIREALILKPGGRNDRTGDVIDADGSIRIRYVSQFGKMNDADLAPGENWIMVMDRMEREFLSVAPALTLSPNRFTSNPGTGGCRIGNSWDEVSEMYEADNRRWLGSRPASAKHSATVEPVMWAPSK